MGRPESKDVINWKNEIMWTDSIKKYTFQKYLFSKQIGLTEQIYLLIIFIGLGFRLWELDGRMMHYDEAIHLHYGWQLARTFNFEHSPWMHGPFQIELVALFIKLVGDHTFIARLPYVLFGVVLIGLPYFIRKQIGTQTSIIVSILFVFSPILSYFSRFGRNDIIIMTLMFLLLVIFWKYIETNKNRYLCISAALLAVLLATKETSYFVIFFIGMSAFIYGAWNALYKHKIYNIKKFWRLEKNTGLYLKKLRGSRAIGFFVLVASIVLPQTAAVFSIPLRWFGIELAMYDSVSGSIGMTGLPQLSDHTLTLGYLSTQFDTYIYSLLMVCGIVGYVLYCKRKYWQPNYTLCICFVSVVFILWLVFGNAIDILTHVIPNNYSNDNSIDVNYGIALFILIALLIAGSVIGSLWHRHVWLVSFSIFYSIWIVLYTTVFTNMPGIFTGSWQSLGYWFAQQEVARGNQPWYYYVVGLSAYELLSFVFGFIGIVILIRRREPFGIIVALWALCSFVVYTIASERMPWLMVNIIVPFIICASVAISGIVCNIRWKYVSLNFFLSYISIPLCLGLLLWILWLNDKPREHVGFIPYWLFALIFIPVSLYTVRTFYKNIRYVNNSILGIVVVLFIISTAGMLRSSYVYDDRYKEMLVYAQGAYDLKVDYYKYIYNNSKAYIDTELRYPMQWYSRNNNDVEYVRFCEKCTYNDLENTNVYLVHRQNVFNANNAIDTNIIRRNLLWYPEGYRRVAINDNNKFIKDIKFLIMSLIVEEHRSNVLKYFIFRNQDKDWFRSEYSVYLK